MHADTFRVPLDHTVRRWTGLTVVTGAVSEARPADETEALPALGAGDPRPLTAHTVLLAPWGPGKRGHMKIKNVESCVCVFPPRKTYLMQCTLSVWHMLYF